MIGGHGASRLCPPYTGLAWTGALIITLAVLALSITARTLARSSQPQS